MLTQRNEGVWGVEINIYAFVISEIGANDYCHTPAASHSVKKPPVHNR
jgi:hypothetical protein